MTIEKTIEILKSKKRVCLLPHRMPDGDAIGSSIALKELLLHFGAKVDLFVEKTLPEHLLFLSEKVEVFDHEKNHPVYDLVVAIDSSSIDRVEDRLSALSYERLLAIDHHITHEFYAHDTLLLESSSTGEIVGKIFEESKAPLTQDAMAGIYVAMATDTGSFRYSNTTASTHQLVARLMLAGLDPTPLNVHLFESETPEKVRLKSLILSKMQLFHQGKMSYVGVTQEDLGQWGFKDPDYEGIVEALRAISGVEVAFFLREVKPGEHKASLRSKFTVDLSDLALSYGGGGHPRAAGFSYRGQQEILVKEVTALVGERL